MAAKKVDPKAKEKRQKMILAGGLVVLAVLMAVQVPKIMHRSSAAAPPPPAPVTTTNADGTTPAPVATPTTLTPPSVATAAPAAAVSASGLADTEVAPAAQEGQLVHFDLFSSKDPFVQQVKDLGAAGAAPPPSSATTTSGGSSSASGSPFGGSTGTTTTTPAPERTAVARISVDGTVEQVVAGGDFPSAAPVFHLDSFGSTSASISVVGGQYQDGRGTLKLLKGKPLTLENMTDATRYRIVFLGRELVATSSLPTTSTAATTTTGATVPTLPVPPTTAATTTTVSG